MAKLFDEYNDRIEAATTELEGIVENLAEYTPPSGEFVEEAPKDGEYYARRNGEWRVAPQGGGGGGGSVSSVNSINPDSEGNVELEASDVGALSEDYTPSWDEVEGKPLFGELALEDDAPKDGGEYVRKDGEWTPSTSLEEAPQDGKVYGRKDGAWEEVDTGGGGGGGGGFPTGTTTFSGFKASGISYDGDDFTEWVSANPYTTADINAFGAYIKGRWKTGFEVFYDALLGEGLPDGTYYLGSTAPATINTAIGETFDELFVGSHLFTKRGEMVTWEVASITGNSSSYMKMYLKMPVERLTGSKPYRGKWFVAIKNTGGIEQGGEYDL